ncbi:hypothetical protein TrVE_jg11780 [Triparma verrucosa]|uniref:Uncharacterized protein n=1 Tax=Triparma verrucosa TaxID=1606542 RepID=A0A9W7F5Y0_9STRA|nr:hypothetical protein TrVE_jg11780 [Triparma verrucosa]
MENALKRKPETTAAKEETKIPRVVSSNAEGVEEKENEPNSLLPSLREEGKQSGVDFSMILEAHGVNGGAEAATTEQTMGGTVATTTKITTPSATTTAESKDSITDSITDIIDIPKILGLKDGEKISVMWELEQGPGLELKRHWWPATLLPWDGRVHTMIDEETNDSQTVPLRLINYEPSVELGYPDETLSECAFLGDHLVYDLGEDNTTMFRLEGEVWEPSDVDLTEADVDGGAGVGVGVGGAGAGAGTGTDLGGNVVAGSSNPGEAVTFDLSRDGLENFLNGLLAEALQRVSGNFTNLSPAKQHMVAEVVAKSKPVLLESMVRKLEGVTEVTMEHIKAIMDDVGETIGSIREEAMKG